MKKYIVKKLLQIIPMIILISLLVFLAIDFSPMDPINYMVSPDMLANSGNIESLRQSLGLNDNVFIRYFRWVRNILSGDFGYSIITGSKITDILKSAIPATFELAVASLIISTIMGISLGLLSAITQNSFIDLIIRFFGVVGTSIPQFFFGILLIQFFAIKMKILPIGGRITPDTTTFLSRMKYMVLPAFTMSIALTATLLRYTRNSFLDALSKDYVNAARAKGMPEWKVYIKHVFRNALRPILVLLIFRLPLLIAGSVVIENVFSWPGIGTIILSSVSAGDYPVIMVTILILSVVILLASILVDLVAAILDPRIRYGG